MEALIYGLSALVVGSFLKCHDRRVVKQNNQSGLRQSLSEDLDTSPHLCVCVQIHIYITLLYILHSLLKSIAALDVR
jgi:hypothetical protein